MTGASRPHPARIYDYLLGGKDHYDVDRQAADALTARAPEARMSVRANRAFLRRAVRYVVAPGVRQILDVGTGLPTTPNIHETARELAPDVRVAHVDNDPVVKAHADALLGDMGATGVVLADVRDPRAVVDHPEVRRVIDFGEPVALFLVAVLHFVTDAEKPRQIVVTPHEALPNGSFLVLSHATGDLADRRDVQAVYGMAGATMNLRAHGEVERFFDGFDPVDPVLVQVPFRRSDGPSPAGSNDVGFYGGVAREAG